MYIKRGLRETVRVACFISIEGLEECILNKRLTSCLLAVVVALTLTMCGNESKSDAKKENEVTIYLDKTNEYIVRQAIGRYEQSSKSDEKNYPDISWNLVDKSYMSAQELQNEILEEMDAGEGPDLVFVDKMSVDNPYELMEKEYLYDMSDMIAENSDSQTYIPGALDEGAIDGKQYLVPVGVTAPLLYTTEEALSTCGLESLELENMADVFELAQSYKEATGNDIFTDDNMWNNMLMFSGLLSGSKSNDEIIDKLSSGESKEFFEQLKNCYADEEKSAYSGYERLSNGTAVIGTEICESLCDFYKNAVLFKNKENVSYVDMPNLDGKTTAVITQAVGINKNTKNADLVYNAVKMFDENHVIYSSYLGRNQAANITIARDPNLTSCYTYKGMMEDEEYYKVFEDSNSSLNDYGGEVFTKIDEITGKDIESVSYYISSEEDDGEIMEQMISYINGECDYETALENVKSALKDETKNSKQDDITTVSVAVQDMGLGVDNGVYKWLQTVQEELIDENIYLSISLLHGEAYDVEFQLMEDAGVGYDVLYLDSYNEWTEFTSETESVEDVAEDLMYSGWEKCSHEEGNYLPVAIRLSGIWYNKEIANSCGIDMTNIGSMDDLISALEQVRNSGVTYGIWTDVEYNIDELSDMFITACGEEYYTEDGNVKLSESSDTEAFDYMKKLLGTNGNIELSDEDAMQQFRDGQLFAVVGECSNLRSLIQDENMDIGFIPLPRGENGQKVASMSFAQAGGFVLSSSCKHMEKAKKALKAAFSSDAFVEYTDRFAMIPVSQAALSTEKFGDMADWETVFTCLHRIPATDVIFDAPEGLSNLIAKYITSDETPEDFYANFAKVIKGTYGSDVVEE